MAVLGYPTSFGGIKIQEHLLRGGSNHFIIAYFFIHPDVLYSVAGEFVALLEMLSEEIGDSILAGRFLQTVGTFCTHPRVPSVLNSNRERLKVMSSRVIAAAPDVVRATS